MIKRMVKSAVLMWIISLPWTVFADKSQPMDDNAVVAPMHQQAATESVPSNDAAVDNTATQQAPQQGSNIGSLLSGGGLSSGAANGIAAAVHDRMNNVSPQQAKAMVGQAEQFWQTLTPVQKQQLHDISKQMMGSAQQY